MLGLDTNVLVRFLVRDDKAQYKAAVALIADEINAGDHVLVSLLVILETEWVLRSRYAVDKNQMLAMFSSLLSAKDVDCEDAASLEEALFIWRNSNADFADCLIGARNRRLGCRLTATFDAKAAKLAAFVLVGAQL
jgi:predicted nucleic-acid-binding protein